MHTVTPNVSSPRSMIMDCAEVDSESLAHSLVRLEASNELPPSPANRPRTPRPPVEFEQWWHGAFDNDVSFIGGAYVAHNSAIMSFAVPACIYIHVRLRGESHCRIVGGPDHDSANPEVQIWSVPIPSLKIVEQPSQRPTRFVAFMMVPEIFKNLFTHAPDICTAQGATPSLITIPLLPSVRAALDAAFDSTLSEQSLRLYRRAKSMEAVALLADSFRHFPASVWQQTPVVHAADVEKIRYAAMRLRTHPEKPWSLASIAREVGLNLNKLKAGFRQLFGVTVFEYLREVRLQTALALVRSTDLGMAQIAYRVGFSSPSHFTQAFRKRFTVAPMIYRSNSPVAEHGIETEQSRRHD